PASAGSLSFRSATNANGTAVIMVTVNDGAGSNAVATQSFSVTVNPVNDPPTLNPISDLTINEDAVSQIVTLTGISTGAPDEIQTLTVPVSNSAPALLTNLNVNYTSSAPTGSLSFDTVRNASGIAIVTVRISDGGGSNSIIIRSFTVTVNPVNDLPDISPLPP